MSLNTVYNWIFISPSTYIDDEVNKALSDIIIRHSKLYNIDHNLANIAYSEREKTKKYFETVVDQPVFMTEDHKRLRSFIIDWYSTNKAELTKLKNIKDINILTNEELNNFILSLGFPYPENIISRSNKIKFLVELVNNYQSKGTLHALANVIFLYGLRDVNISEWWLRYDETREEKIFARSNVVYPYNNRFDPSLEKELSFEKFIANNQFWHQSYDELIEEFDNNRISLPSITSTISIDTNSSLTELEPIISIFQRKVRETYDFWIGYTLVPIFNLIDLDKPPAFIDILNSPPEEFNKDESLIVLVGPNPNEEFYERERQYAKWNTSTQEWEFTTPSDGQSIIGGLDSTIHRNNLLVYSESEGMWNAYSPGKDAVLYAILDPYDISTDGGEDYISGQEEHTFVYNGFEWVDLKVKIEKNRFLNRNQNIHRSIPLTQFTSLYSIFELMVAFSYLHEGTYFKQDIIDEEKRYFYYNGQYSPLDQYYEDSPSLFSPYRDDIDELYETGYDDIVEEYNGLVNDRSYMISGITNNVKVARNTRDEKLNDYFNKFTLKVNYNPHSGTTPQEYSKQFLKAVNPTFYNEIEDIVEQEGGDKKLILENMMVDLEDYVTTVMGLPATSFAYIQEGGVFYNKKLMPVIDFFKPFRVRIMEFSTNFLVDAPLLDSLIPQDELLSDMDSYNVEKLFPQRIYLDTTSGDFPTIRAEAEPRFDYGLGTDDVQYIDVMENLNEDNYEVDTSGSIGVYGDPDHRLEVSDELTIEMVDDIAYDTNNITFIRSFGTDGSGAEEFIDPYYTKYYDNTIYVSDSNNNDIKLFDYSGNYISSPINTVGVANGSISEPKGFDFYNGYLYLCDSLNKRVQIFNMNDNYSYHGKFGTSGTGVGQFNSIENIKIYIDRVFVSDKSNHCIHVFNLSDNTFLHDISEFGTNNNQLNDPRGFTVYDDIVYVCDRGNSRIKLFDTSGNYIDNYDLTYAPHNIKYFDGNLYVTHSGNFVSIIDLNGTSVNTFGSAGTLENQFSNIEGIDIFDGKVIISDITQTDYAIKVFEVTKTNSGETIIYDDTT